MLSGGDEGMYTGLMGKDFGEGFVKLENTLCVGKVNKMKNKS